MADGPDLRKEAILDLINNHPDWYHRIELAPGIITPGKHDSAMGLSFLEKVGLPEDCAGLRALDIGCRDGFYAFELERRGAEVIGIDYAPPDKTGFSIAARILDSNVTYKTDNVYNLSFDTYGMFDIVLFLGVIYHLRNPLLALDNIRTLINAGGLLFIESQVTKDPELQQHELPLWQFNPRDSDFTHTNKWIPNIKGLELVIEECEFRVVRTNVYNNRVYLLAKPVDDELLEYYRELDSSVGLWGKEF